MTVLLLPLLGCHVFETVEIDCVAGMPCAGTGGDTDPAVDTAGDDSGDTDPVDTGPLVTPARHFVVSVTGSRGDRVYAYDEAGTTLYLWKDYGAGTGPVAFDEASGMGVLAVPGMLVWLPTVGDPTTEAIGETVLDVAVAEGVAWVATAGALYARDLSTGETRTLVEDPGDGIAAIAVNPAGGIWVTGRADNTNHLYGVSTDGQITPLYPGYDTQVSRSRVVFAGPEGEPYVCSNVGAPYRVADLAAGEGTPAVYYQGDLDDINECGWDDGDHSWLLFSPSAGVVRVDAQGRGTTALAPPDEFSLVHGNFF